MKRRLPLGLRIVLGRARRALLRALGGAPAAPSGAPPRASFARAVEPLPPAGSEVSDELHSRLQAGDLRAIEAALDAEQAAIYRDAQPADRRRLALACGLLHDVPGIERRTGLRAAAPPAEVHAMGRGAIATGGAYYYADLVAEGLRDAGVEPRLLGAALDFGCSSGRVVRVLQAAYPDVAWHGCDPNGGAIEWAAANLPAIEFAASPGVPPLASFARGSLDLVFAISIWSHFAAGPGLGWLEEMHRLIRPGGHLLLTVCSFAAIAHDAGNAGRAARELGNERRRGDAQLAEIAGALYDEGFWFAAEFGDRGDHGVSDPGWGTAFMTPEWLLSRACPAWHLVRWAPGRVERNQDLVVLRRM